MNERVAGGIVKRVFRTVYAGANYEEVRADRQRRYRSAQAKFLKRPIESYQEELVKVVFSSGFRS